MQWGSVPDWAAAGGLGVLVLATRMAPRLLNPQAIGTDTPYHLLCARAIRANRWRLPRRVHGLCFPSPYDYPPLYHYLLALIPQRWEIKAEPWVGAVLDTINTLVFFWFASLLLPPGPALLAGILFALAPAHTSTTTGPRAYQATPRLLGEMLFNAATLCLVAWKLTGSPGWVVGGWTLGALVMLSSKYSTQALVFFWPVIGIAASSWAVALGPVASGLIALILSRGHYLQILRGQIGHLKLFFKWTSSRLSYVSSRNNWRELLELPRRLLREPASVIKTIFINNSYTKGLIYNPLLIVIAWALLSHSKAGIDPSGGALLGWLGGAVGAWIATGLRPLLFLGEAERYLTHAVAPQVLMVAGLFSQGVLGGAAMAALLALFFVFYLANVALFLRLYTIDTRVTEQLQGLINFLKRSPRTLKLLTLGGPGYRFAYLSGHEIFYSSGNFATCYYPVETYDRIFIRPGVARPPLMETLKRFGLDGVIVKTPVLKEFASYPWDLEVLWLAWEGPSLQLYLLPELKAHLQTPPQEAAPNER